VDPDLPDDFLDATVALMAVAEHSRDDTRTLVWLWGAMFAGAFAWTFDQGAGYAFVKPACLGEDTPVLWVFTVIAVLIAGAGGYTAWYFRRMFGRNGVTETDDRTMFLASVALAFNALIVLLISTAAIPQFVLSPCE
jgi:hypothetical protein